MRKIQEITGTRTPQNRDNNSLKPGQKLPNTGTKTPYRDKNSPTKSPIAQHNNLVNAQYSLTQIQLRMFLYLLMKVKPDDEGFREYKVPVDQITNPNGGGSYETIRNACSDLQKKTLKIETINKRGKRKYVEISIVVRSEYVDGESCVKMKLSEDIMPYLLNLREKGNFTVATLENLMKLSYPAFRLYFLAKERKDKNMRMEIELVDLKTMLDMSDKYPEYRDFKKRVLDKAEQELSNTDLPMSFKKLKDGRRIRAIRLEVTNQVSIPFKDYSGNFLQLLDKISLDFSERHLKDYALSQLLKFSQDQIKELETYISNHKSGSVEDNYNTVYYFAQKFGVCEDHKHTLGYYFASCTGIGLKYDPSTRTGYRTTGIVPVSQIEEMGVYKRFKPEIDYLRAVYNRDL